MVPRLVRLRHLTTGQYLAVDGAAVKLVPGSDPAATNFVLHPTNRSESETYSTEEFVRIEHAKTGMISCRCPPCVDRALQVG